MLTVVNDDAATRDGSLIDEIVREGARRMLARGAGGGSQPVHSRVGARFENGQLIERAESLAA